MPSGEKLGAYSRSLHDSLIEGFMEDKYLIEDQQKVLDADPDFEFQAIAADAALSHFRWLLKQRIEAEQAEETAAEVQAPVSISVRKSTREAVL